MPETRIAIVNLTPGVEPHPSSYRHTDVDGDRLLIATSLIPNVGPGLYFRTDTNGSSIPLTDLPGLIAQLQVIANAAQQEADEQPAV